MGYSNLTRYELYKNAYRTINEVDNLFIKTEEIKQLFYNSAVIIEGFEPRILEDREVTLSDFENLLLRNMERIDNEQVFANAITESLRKLREEKKKELTYKDYFRFLLKSVAEYQNKIINKAYHATVGYETLKKNRKQTFLSYAYYDKGLSLALFYYFWNKLGFLYIDWMWKGPNKNGRVTKISLEKALEESEQLLFLRTTNSEMHVQGNNNSIRQWCSWEIGNFYTKKQSEKYYTSFYDTTPPRNDLLDTFRPLENVENGYIRPYAGI
jgi:hypothetical protein